MQPIVLLFAISFYCHFTSLFTYFNSEVAKHIQTFKETEFKGGGEK